MPIDELDVMTTCWRSIELLDEKERQRVIRWLAQKGGVSGLATVSPRNSALSLDRVVAFIRENGVTTSQEVQAAFGRWPNDFLYRATKKGMLTRVGRGVYEVSDERPKVPSGKGSISRMDNDRRGTVPAKPPTPTEARKATGDGT